MPGKKQQRTAQESQAPALARGLAILELLSRNPQGMILSDIAESLELPKNSTLRMLATLDERGYVARDNGRRTFALTGKLLEMGSVSVCGKDLMEESFDAMRRLRDQTQETVLLNARIGLEGVVLAQVLSPRPVRLVADPGLRFPLHCSAPGKIMLAYLPEVERREICAKLDMPRLTATTITDRDMFWAELETVRRQGYATDKSENIDGVECVSVPVRGRDGSVMAALTVPAPAGRLPDSLKPSFIQMARHQATIISRRLGCIDPELSSPT